MTIIMAEINLDRKHNTTLLQKLNRRDVYGEFNVYNLNETRYEKSENWIEWNLEQSNKNLLNKLDKKNKRILSPLIRIQIYLLNLKIYLLNLISVR